MNKEGASLAFTLKDSIDTQIDDIEEWLWREFPAPREEVKRQLTAWYEDIRERTIEDQQYLHEKVYKNPTPVVKTQQDSFSRMPRPVPKPSATKKTRGRSRDA